MDASRRSRAPGVLVFLAGLLTIGTLRAQVSAVGVELDVASGDQRLGCPVLAMMPEGRFLVSWMASNVVHVRAFDGGGTPGPDVVTGELTGDFNDCTIGADSGGFLLMCTEGGFGFTRVWGQAISPEGMAVGDDFTIDSGYFREGPAITGLPGGGFLVLWTRVEEWLGPRRIYGRRILDGAPVGDAVQIDDGRDYLRAADVSIGPAGGAVVWSSSLSGSDIPFLQVLGRRLTPAGELGPTFQVNTMEYFDNYSPRVDAGPGGFVVSWLNVERLGPAGPWNVDTRARRFLPGGWGVDAADILVTDSEELTGIGSPDVVQGPSGSFLVVYENYREATGDGDSSAIQAQLLPGGERFLVNTTTVGRQGCPRLAAAGSRAVVVWLHDNYQDRDFGIRAQRFEMRFEIVAPAVIPALGDTGLACLAALLSAAAVAALRRTA